MISRIWAVGAAGMCAVAFVAGAWTSAHALGTRGPAHAMAMHGEPKYGPDFKQFDYANPDAPKGGDIVLAAIGTYDTFNAFIVKGTTASGLGLIYETLMVSSLDEAFSAYCHLCETIDVPDDRSSIEFTLRANARWHDGQPITVDDVIWTFETLRSKGAPFYRSYYKNVVAVEQTGERSVKFSFEDTTNMELPLIMGQLTVLPKHYWADRNFEETTMDPPLGSGPYRISEFDPGRSITYQRVEDYWGNDIPTEAGLYNYDQVRFEYYRDTTVALVAFTSGDVDYRAENSSKNWATSYDTPARQSGLMHTVEIPHRNTAGMQGYVFNLRRPMFQDRRVRQAIGYAFDFEWSNANLFYDAYTRTDSYFDNSELSSFGKFGDLPADAEERQILERLRGQMPEDVFTEEFFPPRSDEPGGFRANLRKAAQLLEDAGWVVRDGKRVNAETGEELTFEMVHTSPTSERIALPFARNLERLGITADVRTIDPSQYINRMDNFDFDMTTQVWGQSLSPGNEQRDYWSTESADAPGTRNTAGIKDPVIDELTELVIAAPSRESLVQRTRALDRRLLWGHYVVPHFHIAHQRLAYWDKFGRPDVVPMKGTSFWTWWVDPDKDTTLEQRKQQIR